MALIKCVYCGNSVSDKAFKCPKCGNILNQGNAGAVNQPQPTSQVEQPVQSQQSAQPNQSAQEPSQNRVFVSASGKVYNIGDKQENENKTNTGLIATIVILTVLVVGMVLGIMFWFLGKGSDTDKGDYTPTTKVVEEDRETLPVEGVTLVGTYDSTPIKIFLNVNSDGTVNGPYRNMSVGTKMDLDGVWKDHKIEMTGYIKDGTYRFVLESDAGASTYDLGTRYVGKLYITRPKGDLTCKLDVTVEQYENCYDPIVFRTFTEQESESGQIYQQIFEDRKKIEKKLTNLGFELISSRTERREEYYGDEYYTVRIPTYSRTVNGETTTVELDEYGIEIQFSNPWDVEAFEHSVKSSKLKKTSEGYLDNENIYWAGTNVSIEGTKVILSRKWEP